MRRTSGSNPDATLPIEAVGSNPVVVEVHGARTGIGGHFAKVEFAEADAVSAAEDPGDNRVGARVLGVGVEFRIVD